MKNLKSKYDDDLALRSLLQEWRMETSLTPDFASIVWRRIERDQSKQNSSIWMWFIQKIDSGLPKPALATSYLALLLAIGLTAGWTQGRQTSERIKSELGDRYLRVLNPYQPPRH